jgi:hypothetical protein
MSLLNIAGSLFTAMIVTSKTIPDKDKNKFLPKEIPVPEVWLSSYKQYN